MRRYIRLDTGRIIDTERDAKVFVKGRSLYETFMLMGGVAKDIRLGKIVGRSNRFEELCDYVYMWDACHREMRFERLEHSKEKGNEDRYFLRRVRNVFTGKWDEDARLCVLTDKGLLFVADAKADEGFVLR